ncbi:16797_t:CDS:2, partial [Funneliformis geosporum]
MFYSSFAKLITDFDVIIKCQACYAFRKKTVAGLCSLCSFYVLADWWEYLLNKNYILSGGKDTLVSIKTEGGKTFCYVICALVFEGITIVINPLKALMEDQKHELICLVWDSLKMFGISKMYITGLDIPCALIYANSIQGKSEQAKIFEEIALRFTKVLFITPEKLCLNREFQHFINYMYNNAKVQFVIDEAHYILDYSNF